MQNAVAEIDQWTRKAQAWRVTFDAELPTDDSEAIVVREPRTVAATLTSVDITTLLASPEPDTPEMLEIIWLPLGVTEPSNAERELQAWVALGARSPESAPVRAGIRTVRVFWRDTRAFICTGAQQLPDALDAVVRFTVVAWETEQLERAMQSTWRSIHKDRPMTHAVTRAQLKNQRHVNEMTEFVWRMMESLLRAETALEQLHSGLSEPSKRLYSELVLAASLYDRLEMLEDPIEYGIDHYEIVNTRLIEAGYAAKDRVNNVIWHVMELTIILLLTADLLQRR